MNEEEHPITKLHERKYFDFDDDEEELEYYDRPSKGAYVAAFAVGLKGIALILLEISIVLVAIYSFVTGAWIFGLVLIFLLAPFIVAIGDIATAILLSPLFILAYLLGWRGE